jgi:hypothetical protein
MVGITPILHPASPLFHPRRVKEVESKKGIYIKRNIISIYLLLLFTPTPSRDAHTRDWARVRVSAGGEGETWDWGFAGGLSATATLAPVGPRLAHVASLVAGWSTPPSVARARNVAITRTRESLTTAYVHERESFTGAEHSRIGTPGRSRRGDGRGNANRSRLTFFRKK